MNGSGVSSFFSDGMGCHAILDIVDICRYLDETCWMIVVFPCFFPFMDYIGLASVGSRLLWSMLNLACRIVGIFGSEHIYIYIVFI